MEKDFQRACRYYDDKNKCLRNQFRGEVNEVNINSWFKRLCRKVHTFWAQGMNLLFSPNNKKMICYGY